MAHIARHLSQSIRFPVAGIQVTFTLTAFGCSQVLDKEWRTETLRLPPWALHYRMHNTHSRITAQKCLPPLIPSPPIMNVLLILPTI